MPTPPSIVNRVFWKRPEAPVGAKRFSQIAAILTLTVVASPLSVHASIRGVYSSSTGGERNPALDQTIVATPLTVTVHPIGEWFNKRIVASPLVVDVGFARAASSADPTSKAPYWLKTFSIVASPLQVQVGFNPAISVPGAPVLVTAPTKSNWVKWSTIGALDFTILKDNLAGERPLDWKGKVHVLKMLDTKIIAYGENGVSVLTPSGNAFGMNTIYHIGLKSKQAVADDAAPGKPSKIHYFVDKQAQLWKLSQGLEFLDYAEYLSELVSPVLSYDANERLLYLCDGTTGFVYDPVRQSLGRGPVNVTGIGVQDGTRYVTAPATIAMPSLELTTDIYDFGTRHAKTIQSVECGVDAPGTIQVSIEYRQKIAQEFQRTAWYTLNSRGVKPLNCYGYEFRFRLRAISTGWTHLDYLKVNGHVHDH